MLRIEPLATAPHISEQISAVDLDADEPVTLLNVFSVEPAEADALLKAWRDDAAIMSRQPGFLSTQLHLAVETEQSSVKTFVNYAEWTSLQAFRDAFSQPEFQNSLANYPPSAVARPQLMRKLPEAE